jgi:tripartite-type tricarboxylate transporter receptor subunit TctC
MGDIQMTFHISDGLKRLCVVIASVLISATTTFAAYPEKPVKLVVPFSPGGGTDSIARTLAVGMSQVLGQSVIVENKPGAGTIIGTDAVAKSAPDGYSLVVATFAHAVNSSLIPKLPFDTEKAFTPVVMVARGPNVLVVRTESTLKSVKDLIDLARADPAKLSYASQGNGTSAHLAGEMFENLAQVKMTHVPYRGAGPAMTDLLSGQVDMMFATAAAVAPHIASGKLRAIAVTSPERSPVMRTIPTVAETVRGYAVESWYGLFAPAGTPDDVVMKLNNAAKQATQSAEFRRKMEPEGLVVSTGTPQELDAYVKREESRWRKIVKENNIKPD